MNNQYLLNKNNTFNKQTNLDKSKLNGYQFKPGNKLTYGIAVNKMTVIKNNFIEKILKKKIEKRLELYLRFVVSLVDNDEDTTPTDLRSALTDLTRYKDIVKYKYQKYLDQKYMTLLLKKIELLENELKSKIFYYNEPTIEEEQIENKRSR